MKKCSISGVKAWGAATFVLLFAASTYADSRPQNGTGDHEWRRGRASRDSREADSRGPQENRATIRDESSTQTRSERARGNDSSRANRREETRSDDRQRTSRDARNGTNDSYRNDRGNRNGRDQSNDSYRNDRGNRNDNYRGDSRSSRYNDNQHVNGHGRIRHYSHERGGYRLWLDGAPYPYWIPEAHWRNNWRIGFGISLGGIFRNGMIYTDVYDDPYYGGGYDQRGYGQRYGNDYVSGYVDGIDDRNGTIWLRDDRNGRILTIDSRSIDPRANGIDARDLERGDRITVEGQWLRGGAFAADRIASVNNGSGRY